MRMRIRMRDGLTFDLVHLERLSARALHQHDKPGKPIPDTWAWPAGGSLTTDALRAWAAQTGASLTPLTYGLDD